jgi:hypothetical protein
MARINKTKLTPTEIIYILQSTQTNQELADQLNVTRQAISLIRNGKSWTDIAPEIPRIPVRVKESVRRDYVARVKLCTNCAEFRRGECSYGFPEAIDEPSFATACHLYQRNQSCTN